MKMAIWNIRGLNSPLKQVELRNFISAMHLSFLVLLETRVKSKKSNAIMKACCEGWLSLNNYSEAINGRIWVLWNPAIWSVISQNITDQLVHCRVTSMDGTINCMLTFVYA